MYSNKRSYLQRLRGAGCSLVLIVKKKKKGQNLALCYEEAHKTSLISSFLQ